MISVENVSKKYDNGVLSLDRVSFTVEKGQVLGLVGTNGAGKSTLLRILSGIMRQDSGNVYIDGQEVFENISVKKHISFVSDEGYFPQGFTLNDMANMISSMRENFSKSRFLSLCDTLHLDPMRKTSTFSKGMRRQGEVILALSCSTRYLFFDETFDGLDPIARETARRIIAETVAETNATVIFSSHNLAEIESICDSVALIDRGRLVFNRSIDAAVTERLKYQAAFENDFDAQLISPYFSDAKKSGKLLSFVSDKSREEAEKILTQTFEGNRILYLESVPLTLEEVFSLEVDKSFGGKD